jgi:hypothetical protein
VGMCTSALKVVPLHNIVSLISSPSEQIHNCGRFEDVLRSTLRLDSLFDFFVSCTRFECVLPTTMVMLSFAFEEDPASVSLYPLLKIKEATELSYAGIWILLPLFLSCPLRPPRSQ